MAVGVHAGLSGLASPCRSNSTDANTTVVPVLGLLREHHHLLRSVVVEDNSAPAARWWGLKAAFDLVFEPATW